MKTMLTGLLSLCVLLGTPGSAHADPPASEDPLYRVADMQTPAKAINYRDLRGSVEIDFKGTVLLPRATGTAKIENDAGSIEVNAKFENVTSATQFGSEYLTYVFWAISPDGRATNLGELKLDKSGNGRMKAETTLQALSLLVTAEPYFAVSRRSEVVVLENAIRPGNHEKIGLVDANFVLLPRGQCTKKFSAADRRPVTKDKKTPFSVCQARNAVRISREAGADVHAAERFAEAERLLALSETTKGRRKSRDRTARQTVQSAEAGRLIAEQAKAAEAVATERRLAARRIGDAESQTTAAERAKRKSDAELAAAVESAAKSAASSARAKADARDARAAAEESRTLADLAASRAREAEVERAAMRARLLEQLNSVLQTRDTARGLIVNMSEALFQTGSANLQPQVREKLARVAGIVSSQVGLMLEVEGHTDDVGTDEANQLLSEKRARAARDYLISQCVSANAIVSRGFGERSPVESNDTARGRQSNRRVEIVVTGDSIGTLTQYR